VFHSDKIEVTQYLIRRGNYLTFVVVSYDPVYLTEPIIRSTEYQLALNQQLPPYPCTVVTEVDRPKGVVPHYLPGTNPDVSWFARRYNIPLDDHGRRRQHVSGDSIEDSAVEAASDLIAAPAQRRGALESAP
jgi:hypothetical protein